MTNLITVKKKYNLDLEVNGVVVNIALISTGGVPAIEVKTEQFDTQLFPVNHHLTHELIGDPDYDPFRQMAREICVFAATGRHPRDIVEQEPKIFREMGLQLAADILRDMYGKEIQKA